MNNVLYILRHAQSAGTQAGSTDKDRHLTAAGKESAQRLGLMLNKDEIGIQHIITSTAVRAIETARLVNESLQLSPAKIRHESDLYEAFPSTLWELVRTLPADTHHVLVVGHNPVLSEFASALLSKAVDLSPCECLGIEWPGNWAKRPSGACNLIARFQP
ncbi:MAG: histidine phosphatase family protein [Bacteroidetes bacterium]|nr:histidine phosphatase family protein [Bacteroidota bacterium]